MKKIISQFPDELLVLLKSFYRRARTSLSLHRVLQRYEVISKALALKRALKRNKKITIVYDNYCSPPTYGDFLYVLFLARYIERFDKNITFIVIYGDYRKDWGDLKTISPESFVVEQERLSRVMLSKTTCIKLLKWREFKEHFHYTKISNCVLFQREIFSRSPIYTFSFNLLNYILKWQSADFLRQVLLSKETIRAQGDYHQIFPYVPYIAVSCRRSVEWGFERNIKDEEFISIVLAIREKLPNSSVLCISDSIGCDYFKKVSEKSNLSVRFSKDYSDDFLGDTSLILGAEAFIQLRGGGIAIPIIFSGTPYFITSLTGHEVLESKDKLTSWATGKQWFIVDNRISEIRLTKFLTSF
jgi:hypothetical protein